MKTIANESFGQRLRRLRDENGHTQQSLAEAAATKENPCDGRQIRYFETDRMQPRLALAAQLAAALGVTLDELVHGSPEVSKN